MRGVHFICKPLRNLVHSELALIVIPCTFVVLFGACKLHRLFVLRTLSAPTAGNVPCFSPPSTEQRVSKSLNKKLIIKDLLMHCYYFAAWCRNCQGKHFDNSEHRGWSIPPSKVVVDEECFLWGGVGTGGEVVHEKGAIFTNIPLYTHDKTHGIFQLWPCLIFFSKLLIIDMAVNVLISESLCKSEEV